MCSYSLELAVGYCVKCAVNVFASKQQKDATNAERAAFISNCLPYSFNTTTHLLLENATCDDNDLTFASVWTRMF